MQTQTKEEMRKKFYDLAVKTTQPASEVLRAAAIDLYDPPESLKITSWNFFNEMTGGLRMHEFTILCGATGSGKTSWLANVSANLLTQGEKHFVAPVENGDADFIRRVMSVFLEQDVNDGSEYSRERVNQWLENIGSFFDDKSLLVSAVDSRMPMEFLLQKLKYAVDSGCKVAMLDNLNFFLDVKFGENQLIEMDNAVHRLVMFTKHNPIHVILVMHPRKTENGRVESEFDIKGSSTAVQEACNVFLFNRPKKNGDGYVNGYTHFHRELKAAKLRRRGKFTGSAVIFNGRTPNYVEVELI